MTASANEIRQMIDGNPALYLREIAAQLAELNANLRAAQPDAHLPQECREHKCSYYMHYLAYGGPDLVHEGFHAAEKICENLQKQMSAWMDNPANDGKQVPESLSRICQRAEERIRA